MDTFKTIICKLFGHQNINGTGCEVGYMKTEYDYKYCDYCDSKVNE